MKLTPIMAPLVALTWLSIAGLKPAYSATLEAINSRPGVTEQFALLVPQDAPIASVILLAGGDGNLHLTPNNLENLGTNFLVRTRRQFLEQGFQVAVIDSPSDQTVLREFRLSTEHATDIAAVIHFLRSRAPVPVWLIGTSRGSVSAANAASRLAGSPETPDGIVLTSTVTGTNKNNPVSVLDVALNRVAVPVLIVHHRNDGCRSATYSGAKGLTRAFPHSPKVEFLDFDGGQSPESPDCEPLSPHGYFGIEDAVVNSIAAWIRATPSTAGN